MANLTLPSATSDVAKCPHCGQGVKLDPVWVQFLDKLVRLINANLP